MSKTAREFVANDLWMVISVLTLGTIMVLGILGLGRASSLVVAVGWFILTPLFLFWGEEIAAFLYGESESQEQAADTDPLTELKQRYARGEIDDAEFERRLERLVELDEIPQRVTEETMPDSDQEERDRQSNRARNRDLES